MARASGHFYATPTNLVSLMRLAHVLTGLSVSFTLTATALAQSGRWINFLGPVRGTRIAIQASWSNGAAKPTGTLSGSTSIRRLDAP